MNNFYEKNNQVVLRGICQGSPKYSHSVMGEGFYEFTLAVARLSAEVDYLPVTISERLLPEIKDTSKEIGIIGQLRSYNKLEGEKSRLILTIFVREIVPAEELNLSNQISITGYVCKEPIYRTTPFGREITDILIAVNRAYNKSDYLPCIAWGRNARFAGDLEVGEKVELTGRIQSRTYTKKIDENTSVNKTAYEVSVASIMTVIDEKDFDKEEKEMDDNEKTAPEKTVTDYEDEYFSEEDAHVSTR